jgi:hypothetical protein
VQVFSEVEIDGALEKVTASLNRELSTFDAGRVQEIAAESLGEQVALSVDDGGGLHDETSARVGAIRRTDSGKWIIERQNDAADRCFTAVPAEGRRSGLRKLLGMHNARR